MADRGVWTRLEDWLLALQRDRARMARYFQVAYWISTLFLLFGVVAAILIFTGVWRP